MIKVRKNVDISRLRSEAMFAWFTVIAIVSKESDTVELTSGQRDRKVGEAYSKHNDGLAVDFITHSIINYTKIIEELKKALPGYDVIYHDDVDGKGKHFHIEWDRKRLQK